MREKIILKTASKNEVSRVVDVINEEGGITMTLKDGFGVCVAHGDTREQALSDLREAFILLTENTS